MPQLYVEMLKDVVDHWIIDIKDMNPHIYKAYTGNGNKQVISNLQYLIDNNAKITARVPLIAGFNTELDVKNSILSLERMGIIDIDRFTYTVKKH